LTSPLGVVDNMNNGSEVPPSMSAALLTTGKAARLCSVKPDTVLKWIKKGRLRASRTAGGHYRVEERDVTSLLTDDHTRDEAWEQHSALCSRPLRCWEYMSHGPGTECKDCVVYQVRATFCFRMTNVVKGSGHSEHFCTGVCQECPYYRRVHGMPTNVLVITRDEALIQELAKRTSDAIDFRFARRGYDASAIVAVFRPAFVVFDQALLETVGAGLLEDLVADRRTAGVRILVAVRNGTLGCRIRNRAIYAAVEEPFHADEIVSIINRIPVETLEAEPE
jgi:excisionase family DNA binding protein